MFEKKTTQLLDQETLPSLLLPVCSRNGLELEFTLQLTYIEGLMKDWIICQLSSVVKYSQNQNIHSYFSRKANSILIQVIVLHVHFSIARLWNVWWKYNYPVFTVSPLLWLFVYDECLYYYDHRVFWFRLLMWFPDRLSLIQLIVPVFLRQLAANTLLNI